MADAPAPAPAPSGNTPPADAAPPVAAAPAVDAKAPVQTPTPTPTSDAKPAESPKAAVAPDAPQDGKPPAEPVAAPLFKAPEDMKFAPDAVEKFTGFIKGKLQPDGSLLMKPQDVMDQFADQARDTVKRWEKHIADTDAANAKACKERFTPTQLGQAETMVGFLSSFDPEFRDFAKAQLNSPVFVNAMRLMGERLSEDVFEEARATAQAPPKRSAAERMGYAKPKPN